MPFSDAKRSVFKAFNYSLGMGDINGFNYNKIKVYLTDSNFYNTNWRRMKGIKYTSATEAENQLNYYTIRLGDLYKSYEWSATVNDEIKIKGASTRIYKTNLYLPKCNLDSFNRETESTNTSSYEGLLDIAASSKIFTENDNNGSWVTGDLDWVNSPDQLSDNLSTYFSNEYNFKDEYNKTEYQSYGLGENRLTENVIRLSAESFLLDGSKPAESTSAMDNGAGGVLLTYYDSDKGFVNENEIPIAFYDFGKTLHSNYSFIQIDWHEDGVIKAE